MIDIEGDVFEYVASAVESSHPGTEVGDEYEKIPASFPAVTIREADNHVVQRYRTTENIENAAYIMYEASVYSNKKSGKKAEAKAIMQTVDDAFASIGFVRTIKTPVPNYADATVYRIISRYVGTAIPNDDEKIYIYSD